MQALALADGLALPPPVLGAHVPPPSDGEDSGDAASDATRFHAGTQEEEPAPPPAAVSSTDGVLQRRRWQQDILASEHRIMARMDHMHTYMQQTVESFNSAPREGLGEVEAKYRVALADLVHTHDAHCHGGASPTFSLKTKYELEGFKLTIFEFRGLIQATADNVCRDTSRFLVCFEFDDIAGQDFANLMVSIRRTGLMKQLFFSDLWQAKSTYVVSLKTALKHFQYLEHEERAHKAVGGLTTALGGIIVKALDYNFSMLCERRRQSVVLFGP